MKHLTKGMLSVLAVAFVLTGCSVMQQEEKPKNNIPSRSSWILCRSMAAPFLLTRKK
ncbi:MAG TPA: hypothetical protein VGD40_00350 [Chryseosolibacter sp.]